MVCMERYIQPAIVDDLQKKMVFVGGPRQVGKTTMALDVLAGDEQHPAYFNWDYADDKRILLQGGLPVGEHLIILDEIHNIKNGVIL